MKLCYIGRVPTNWWPRRVLCALWTRRPIVKVAMGCHTEPAAEHIAHVLQRLHFFQFFNFFNNLHDLPQKKITRPYPKNKKFNFFLIIYTTYRKKNYTHLPQKNIPRLDHFFVHDLHFSRQFVVMCAPSLGSIGWNTSSICIPWHAVVHI